MMRFLHNIPIGWIPRSLRTPLSVSKWDKMKIGSMETCMFTSLYQRERPNDAFLAETENRLEVKKNIN